MPLTHDTINILHNLIHYKSGNKVLCNLWKIEAKNFLFFSKGKRVQGNTKKGIFS